MFPQSSGPSSSSDIRSIAFVDSNISYADSLIEELSDHHVIQLSAGTNGIEEMTQTLSQYQNLDSIHVFSHGTNGSIQLGNTLLSQAVLNEYHDDLESWGQALTDTGDLLFYGCNVAATEEGLDFVEHVSQLTQADVAASNDITGNANLGGDWDLEVILGAVEDSFIGENYQGTFARVQAETGTFSGNASFSDIHSGFDDAGFVGFLNSVGSGVELNTSAATEGSYDLDIRYAAGNHGPDIDRSVSLIVNDNDAGQLSFARTGDWSTWSTLSTTVDLQAGNNTIEFHVDGDDTGYINVDYIDIDTADSLDPVGLQGPQTPTSSSYQLDLTTFATHSEFQSGGGSNPAGTASSFGAIEVNAPRDGSGRVFMSSQTGKILGYDQNGDSLGTLLDLASTSSTTGFVNGEGANSFRGLMYFDFHPDFNNLGAAGYRKVYAGYQVTSSFDDDGANADYRIQNYTSRANGNQYAIGEWTVGDSNPDTVDPESFREVFRVQMEDMNPHGFGQISFNPNSNPEDADYGLLYAAIGDANANGNLPPGPGYLQNLDNPFGKIIRINPLQNESNSYSIPNSNPFVGDPGAAQEIYALGFRDPQTFSFGKDNAGEDVLITFDIGANEREEISLVRSGGNYGWGRFEGTRLNNTEETLATGTVNSPPVLEYDHTTGGFAIIGGIRVTDPNNPNFADQVLFSDLPTGKFFYADYQELLQAESNGFQARFFEINSFTKDGVTVTENAGGGSTNPGVTFEDVVSRDRGDARFGTDEQGNVYIVTKQAGNIFRTGLVQV